MKKTYQATLLCLFALQLSACSSQYVIATKEGQILLTQNRPTLDNDTGLLSYVDEAGRHRQINNDTVSQIAER